MSLFISPTFFYFIQAVFEFLLLGFQLRFELPLLAFDPSVLRVEIKDVLLRLGIIDPLVVGE